MLAIDNRAYCSCLLLKHVIECLHTYYDAACLLDRERNVACRGKKRREGGREGGREGLLLISLTENQRGTKEKEKRRERMIS